MKKEKIEVANRAHSKIFAKYSTARLVFHPNLSVPMRILYNDHLQWSGADALPAGKFVKCLIDSGIRIEHRGKGKLKRVAHGVGTKPY